MTSDASCQISSVLESRLRVGMNSSQAFFKLVSENSAHFGFGSVRQARGQSVGQHQHAVLQRAQAFGPHLTHLRRWQQRAPFLVAFHLAYLRYGNLPAPFGLCRADLGLLIGLGEFRHDMLGGERKQGTDVVCPRCGLERAYGSYRCDCGYSFAGGKVEKTTPTNLVLHGRQGKTLTVSGDTVRIQKESLWTSSREKAIAIRNITSVEVKKPGTFVVGFIQFSLAGGIARDSSYTWSGGAYDAAIDENSVTFTGTEAYEIALGIKAGG